MASSTKGRILIVESDPGLRDLIGRQSLKPLGYRVKGAELASEAIQLAGRFAPDIVIANLNLPDLSGKDLLVALASYGAERPIIVYTEKGGEANLIQAFRLGAADYVSWPIREAEVVAAVERAIAPAQARQERERMAQKLAQINKELQRRVRDLTTIFAVGKVVTSTTNQQKLFNQIVEGALKVSEADLGWLLTRDSRQKAFVLSAHRKLPANLAVRLNMPLDDGVSSLVALSGETLEIHGTPLKRFNMSKLGQAALVVPVKSQKKVIGLLIAVRKAPKAFGRSEQTLMEAVADYASIALINGRLFSALERRAQRLQKVVEEVKKAEKSKADILRSVSHEVRNPLTSAKESLDEIAKRKQGQLADEQWGVIQNVQEKLQNALDMIQAIAPLHDAATPNYLTTVNLNDLIQKSIERNQVIAKKNGVKIVPRLQSMRTFIAADPKQVSQVLVELVSNAIKFSPEGGQVTIRTAITQKNFVQVSVQDNGIGVSQEHIPRIFERFYQADQTVKRRFGGVGVGLALVKEIATAHGGKVWAESQVGRGSIFHVTFPKA